MRVIGEKILVKVDKPTGCMQKIGGLDVPVGPGAGEYEIAHVIGVGEKVTSVSEGDTLYIYFGSGKEFSHEGNKYRTITLNEIIAVI
jgi:co-chaperonin GroES (HSP10)